jgi:hypothetical protein
MFTYPNIVNGPRGRLPPSRQAGAGLECGTLMCQQANV